MKTALIIDDEAEARDLVRAVLEPEGWMIAEAGDGDSGLRMARETKPDLVVLDVQMPRKDGFRVFEELARNQETAGLKIIMLTGVGEKTGLSFSADDMQAYLGREPDAYVEKPVVPESFKRVVDRVTLDG